MKEAKIQCPHCGRPIIVRDKLKISDKNAAKIMSLADKMLESMDRHFKAIFDPSLWK